MFLRSERNSGRSTIMKQQRDWEDQKFRQDMKNLPDDRGFDEFADISVEDFGAAVLAGYGWKEGQGIGRNAKVDTKVFESKRWSGTRGLGSATKVFESKRWSGIPGLGSAPEKPPVPPAASKGVEKKTGTSHRSCSDKERDPVAWLRSDIRVRVISKDFRGGKLYLKEGKVVDVVGPRICDLSIDESGELLQGVDQEILETVPPKRGVDVLILYGRHRGVFGILVEKDMEKETAVVQDAHTLELIKVLLEQIAELAYIF